MNIRSAYLHFKKNVRMHWAFILVSVVFLLVSNTAQINYALRATPDFRYTGANPYAASDKLVYKNMIEQGREGYLFMRNVHTTDPQRGSMLSPLWFVMGQTARWFDLSNTTVYQLYRVIFTVLFSWLLYLFLSQLFRTEKDRVLAALMIYFSGGFGWLYIVRHPWIFQTADQIKFLNLPVDVYVTEGNTLLNFSQAALFGFSQVLLLGSVYLFVRYRDAARYHWDILNAFLIMILGLMHPYDLPIVFAVLGSWSVWHIFSSGSWRSLRRLAILAIGGGLAAGYDLYIVTAEPVLREWYNQNLVYSPPGINYLWGYGLLGVLALVAAALLFRKKRHDPWWAAVIIWCAVVPVLVYLPLDVSRRFINGWHIMLASMAYYACRYLYRAIQHVWLRVVYMIVIIILLGSSLGLYFFINLYFEPDAYAYGHYYITKDEQRLIDFLRTQTRLNDRLLTSDEKTSFTITGELNRLVYLGHEHQTPRVQLRQQQLDWFFSEPQGDSALDDRKQFLIDTKTDYIIVSSLRLQHEVPWLSQAPFVRTIFNAGPFTVYRVGL